MTGLIAPNKIPGNDLYYSDVKIAFPDLENYEDEIDLKQYELFNNAETTFDKNLGVILHHSSTGNKTFCYKLQKDKRTVKYKSREFSEESNAVEDILYEVTVPEINLYLNGVYDEVYTAPNKRLVIHPYTSHINFAPKANGGLTFVLSKDIKYIDEKFWQPGNSYILNEFSDRTTLNYLKSIKDQHKIDISDQPDVFGFWNISKKAPFTINRIHVYQMN